MKAVSAQSIIKTYNNITALDKTSLTVGRGDIYGLVGPDGAGKTTLMRILVGILSADSGRAEVMGKDVFASPDSVKTQIGYMSQRFSLYGDLTVKENMEFYADLFEVEGKEKQDRVKRLLEFSRLEPFLARRADALSGGMKQKLGLSCALIHTPELLFLDEPTTGVDPVSRRELWGILYDLWKEGMTIFVSTPYLDEAERCTKLGFIYHGKVIVEDTPENIKKDAGFSIIQVTLSDMIEARNKLDSIQGLPSYNIFGKHLHFPTKNSGRDRALISRILKASKLKFTDITVIRPTLEDIFLHLTGTDAEEE